MSDFYCEIRRAGVSPEGLAQMELKDVNGAFDWTTFLSSDGLAREMLATALAAVVSGKRLDCSVVDPVITWARIYRLTMIK